jgi:ribonuclease D
MNNKKTHAYKLFYNDIPSDLAGLGKSIAIDTEAMGLSILRDRLCLIQMCDENNNIVLVKFNLDSDFQSPNLIQLFTDPSVEKIFHFARFDVAIIKYYLKIQFIPNIFCTKISSKLVRTYTDRHGLKTLVREFTDVVLDKEQQTSNWGSSVLSKEQIDYAISDVLYLHRIKDGMLKMLESTKRREIAYRCFDALNLICDLDIQGFSGSDAFNH